MNDVGFVISFMGAGTVGSSPGLGNLGVPISPGTYLVIPTAFH